MTVAELAARASVSVSLLDERFRSVLAMPPIRYLTGWRMHLAEDLLQGSDLAVGVVARWVGYESEEAFSRAFKRLHGTSPARWRSASSLLSRSSTSLAEQGMCSQALLRPSP